MVRKKKCKITKKKKKKREEFTDSDHRRKKPAGGGGTVDPSAVWSRAAAFNSKLQGVEDATRLLEESDGADD